MPRYVAAGPPRSDGDPGLPPRPTPSLGDRDHGGIDDSQRQIQVGVNEFRQARHVSVRKLRYVEPVASERLQEGHLRLRPDSGLQQIADLAQDRRRHE
jgi:hypothetical protein